MDINDDDLSTNSNEQTALELALKYNFVTKLTSLYVVKPDDENINGKNNSQQATIDPVPISLTPNRANAYGSSSYGVPQVASGYGYSSYGAPQRRRKKPSYSASPAASYLNQAASYAASILPPSPMASSASGYSSYGGSPTTGMSTSGGVAQSALRGVNRLISNIGGGLFKSRRPRPRPNIQGGWPGNLPVRLSSDKFQTNFGNKNSTSLRKCTTTTTEASTTTIDSSQCSLTMFSKTYLRGQKLTLTPQNNYRVLDMAQSLFDNKLASLEVVGPCCWEIYEEPNFSGQSKMFSKGEYKSATDIGSDLIKEASSVLMTSCFKNNPY
jgi:hypothetical protein